MKKKILLSEDEIIIAMDIKYQLEKMGHSVTAIANSRNEILTMVNRIMPDLIITNVKHREQLDGIETIKQIRTHFDIPVLFITSQNDKFTHNKINEIKYTGFLSKPFVKDELLHVIDNILIKHKHTDIKDEFAIQANYI